MWEAAAICFVRFGGEAGFPRPDAGKGSGESRIVDGDGILIVSIPRRWRVFEYKRMVSGMKVARMI